MGTSTVNRSPQTYGWRIVNNLYEQPTVPMERLLEEIFRAASDQYTLGLADEAVIRRVESLIATTEEGTWRNGQEEALLAAQSAIAVAQSEALQSGTVSFFGDLADRALHITFTRGAREPDQLSSIRTALSFFLANLVGSAIDHVVARDLTAHLGRGKAVGVEDALNLRRSLVERAKEVAVNDRVTRAIEEVITAPHREWAKVISQAWESGAASSAVRRR